MHALQTYGDITPTKFPNVSDVEAKCTNGNGLDTRSRSNKYA